MNLLLRKRSHTKSRKTSKVVVASPTDSRRPSRVVTSIVTSAGSREGEKQNNRPSITMIPTDSAASLPMIAPPLARPRRVNSSGPYCPKRPTLQAILANQSPEPWTLDAFTSYCQQSMSAENINFVLEADRYTKRWHQWSDSKTLLSTEANNDRADELVRQWRNMLGDYVVSGAAQELNLEGGVRRTLTNILESDLPPDPSQLRDAVSHTKKLIEDSVLPGFLNEIQPEGSSDENLDKEIHRDPRQGHSQSLNVIVPRPGSRPSSREDPAQSASFSSHFMNRSPAPSEHPRPRPLGSPPRSRPKSMFTRTKEHSSSSSGTPGIDARILDDTAVASPVVSNAASTSSPPMSPPQAEHPTRERSDSGWRKIGAKLGLRKKRSDSELRRPQSTLREEPSSSFRS